MTTRDNKIGIWLGVLGLAVPILWSALAFAITMHAEIQVLKSQVERLQDEKDQLMQAVMNLEEPQIKHK
jgi:hypothetical protein